MKYQEPTQLQRNKRVFERVSLDGSIHFDGVDYTINDLSVGGLSVVGKVPGWEEGDIRRVQFTIRHGALIVSGRIQCQCLKNSEQDLTRFRLVDPSEDLSEFLRAVTLRSVSGSEYDVGWLPENSSKLQTKEDTRRHTWTSQVLSLPMLVLAMFLVLLGAFVVRKTEGDAYWVTEAHQIASPVTGQIKSLNTGPFDVGEPISEIVATSVSGEAFPFTITADVASIFVNWRFSTGDIVSVDDVLGYVHNVPRNNGRFFAIVSLQVPFFRLEPGDSISIESVDGRRIIGAVRRFLPVGEARNYATNNDQFAWHRHYALIEISDAAVDFSAPPKVRILDTILENEFR